MPSGNSIQLSKAAVRDWMYIVHQPAEAEKVLDAANKDDSAKSVPELTRRVATKLSLNPEDVRKVLHGFLNVMSMKERLEAPSNELVELIGGALDQSEPWTAEYRAAWNEVKGLVTELIDKLQSGHNALLVEKTSELIYSHENLLQDASVITDIRPVFDDTADVVKRAVVLHTLLVTYFSASNSCRIEFAMDAADVRALRRACDRALKKAETLKQATSGMSWGTFSPRDEPEGTAT